MSLKYIPIERRTKITTEPTPNVNPPNENQRASNVCCYAPFRVDCDTYNFTVSRRISFPPPVRFVERNDSSRMRFNVKPTGRIMTFRMTSTSFLCNLHSATASKHVRHVELQSVFYRSIFPI